MTKKASSQAMSPCDTTAQKPGRQQRGATNQPRASRFGDKSFSGVPVRCQDLLNPVDILYEVIQASAQHVAKASQQAYSSIIILTTHQPIASRSEEMTAHSADAGRCIQQFPNWVKSTCVQWLRSRSTLFVEYLQQAGPGPCGACHASLNLFVYSRTSLARSLRVLVMLR